MHRAPWQGQKPKDVADGKDGKAGKDGKNGKAGKDDKDGKDGKAGKDGKDGKAGKDDKDGKAGKDGEDGKDKAKPKPAQTVGELSRDKSRLVGHLGIMYLWTGAGHEMIRD